MQTATGLAGDQRNSGIGITAHHSGVIADEIFAYRQSIFAGFIHSIPSD